MFGFDPKRDKLRSKNKNQKGEKRKEGIDDGQCCSVKKEDEKLRLRTFMNQFHLFKNCWFSRLSSAKEEHFDFISWIELNWKMEWVKGKREREKGREVEVRRKTDLSSILSRLSWESIWSFLSLASASSFEPPQPMMMMMKERKKEKRWMKLENQTKRVQYSLWYRSDWRKVMLGWDWFESIIKWGWKLKRSDLNRIEWVWMMMKLEVVWVELRGGGWMIRTEWVGFWFWSW